MAYIELDAGQFFVRELRPTCGFLLEDSRILVDVVEGRVTKLEITKERDGSIPYLDPYVYGGGIIYIPPTGQDMSMVHYLGGAGLLVISLAGAGFLLKPHVKKLKFKGVNLS